MNTDILFFTRDMSASIQEILNSGGRITHQLTDFIFVANIPDSIDVTKLKFSQLSPLKPLDPQSQIIVDAWKSLGNKLVLDSSTVRGGSLESEYKPWDTDGYQPPEKDDPLSGISKKKSSKSTGTPTSLYMTGSISVGLVVVSGVDSDLEFSNSEQIKVVQEVMEGLRFLANAEPSANITFIYRINFVTVNATPNPGCSSYESCESVWRDPALMELGYNAGYSGCVEYADALISQNNSDWSYVAFFTKYPLKHFAYAGGVRLVMQYSNDGWGPDIINQVFAHETCHIFGAADEYGTCNCQISGSYKVPNMNCINCTQNQVQCLMDGNVLSLCYFSRGQIGWWPNNASSIGAITVDNKRPYTFVKGDDGNLWVRWWSGSAWSWSNQGTPPGISITDSMGAITVDGGRPYVFIKGDDGNLWVQWWSGSAWFWSNQGTPPGISITDSMGAVTVDGGRPYVFIKGDDGNLWVQWWSGSAWSWSNQGTPPGISITDSMGAITVDGGRPYVFIKGNDGNLWVQWWSGSAWSWSNQGTPSGVSITDSMGAITVDGGRPYVFIKGNDGNLWVQWWSGSAWSWSNQGTPSGVSITDSMGAITVDGGRPYVFIKGNDGNLWVQWWSGSAWSWSNQGAPSGVSITDSMGAITVDGGRPYVYIKGSDENVWENWWSGNAWSWSI